VSHLPFRVVVALAGACAVCLSVTACDSGGGGPLAGLSAKQVLDKAVSDLKSAPSFTVTGSGTDVGGHTFIRDLGFKPGKGCVGTVTQVGGGSYAMVLIGTTTWVKPDDAFWKADLVASQASRMIALQHGRYLKGSTADSEDNQLTKPCDLNALTSQLSLPTDVVMGGVTTFNGQPAVPLTDKALGGVIYVTDTSTPQVLQIVTSFAGDGSMSTFDVGAPVTVTAPPASQSTGDSLLGG